MDEIVVAIQNAANTIATPNWADIMSVCFSLAAVIVACIVAWRQNEISRKQTSIADKQNRIALFEKRLEIYDILKSCNSSVEIIKSLGENEDILKYLFIIFSDKPEEYREYNRNEARLYLTDYSIKLHRAAFFFPEKIVPYIVNVSINLLNLTDADIKTDGPRKYNERKLNYYESIKALDENKVFESIREEINML